MPASVAEPYHFWHGVDLKTTTPSASSSTSNPRLSASPLGSDPTHNLQSHAAYLSPDNPERMDALSRSMATFEHYATSGSGHDRDVSGSSASHTGSTHSSPSLPHISNPHSRPSTAGSNISQTSPSSSGIPQVPRLPSIPSMEEDGSPEQTQQNNSQSSSDEDGGTTKLEVDDDAASKPAVKKKRTRTLTTAYQATVLNALLSETRFPSTEIREQVGKQIGMSPRRVQIWFQNRRQGQKKIRDRAETAAPPTFNPSDPYHPIQPLVAQSTAPYGHPSTIPSAAYTYNNMAASQGYDTSRLSSTLRTPSSGVSANWTSPTVWGTPASTSESLSSHAGSTSYANMTIPGFDPSYAEQQRVYLQYPNQDPMAAVSGRPRRFTNPDNPSSDLPPIRNPALQSADTSTPSMSIGYLPHVSQAATLASHYADRPRSGSLSMSSTPSQQAGTFGYYQSNLQQSQAAAGGIPVPQGYAMGGMMTSYPSYYQSASQNLHPLSGIPEGSAGGLQDPNHSQAPQP